MQIEALQNINIQAFLPQPPSGGGGGGVPDAPQVPQSSQPTLADAIIQFVNDQKSGRVLLQIVQPDSGKVIRQIPSEDDMEINKRLGQVLDKIA